MYNLPAWQKAMPAGHQAVGEVSAMSTFWIIGIIVNVTLTGLGIYWVIRNMAPRDRKSGQQDPQEPDR